MTSTRRRPPRGPKSPKTGTRARPLPPRSAGANIHRIHATSPLSDPGRRAELEPERDHGTRSTRPHGSTGGDFREPDRRHRPVDLKFQVGDNAVYPAHGVAQITGIESRDIAGQKKE